ncbi:MAG: amidohydrolase, partial [Pseudomonadota bacterium]
MSHLPKADILLTGGRVWCGLEEGFCEAVALWSGRVLATGSAADLEPLRGPDTRVIDLRGRLATPGLNDAHMHLIPYGLGIGQVDLSPSTISTLDELLGALKTRAAQTPPGEWIVGRGYDHFELDVKRHPHRTELDAAVPDHPVWIVRTDGHIGVANSMGLEMAGITDDTPSPEGGLIERVNGVTTGLLAETAREIMVEALPKASVEELVDAIDRAGHDLLSYGITSIMEAAVGLHHGWTEMQAYMAAKRAGRLPVRTFATLMGDKNRNVVNDAYQAGLVTGYGDEMLRIGPVKIFTDGSAGGRTAAMTKPYLGGGDNDLGILCLPDAELDAMVLDAHRKGYRMAIHAIGDAAIEQVLNALEAALHDTPDDTRRHRIEHCGWLRPEQMDRMVAHHILPAPQPTFIYYFGDLYLSLVEEERANASYPMRTWMDRGLYPSASTDCPVTPINPFPCLYSMVTRATNRGTVLGADQRLSLAEALHAYTYAAAYGAREEAIKGRLVPGQLADVAVFSRDMFDGEPD